VDLPKEGWVGIRAMVAEDKSGEHDGKPYTMVRHYSTLTFPYAPAKTEAVALPH
jgi:hypothetical protein